MPKKECHFEPSNGSMRGAVIGIEPLKVLNLSHKTVGTMICETHFGEARSLVSWQSALLFLECGKMRFDDFGNVKALDAHFLMIY